MEAFVLYLDPDRGSTKGPPGRTQLTLENVSLFKKLGNKQYAKYNVNYHVP